MKNVGLISMSLVSAYLLTACSGGGGADSGLKSPFDVNRYSINKTVCNPLNQSSTPVTVPSQGLKAQLWSLPSGSTIYHDVESMIQYGVPSDKNLFFSDIFVPTRMFTEGFPLQSGGSVKTDAGQTLIEYFALRYTGLLHLGPNEAEGDYQIGMLSDDGAIMTLSDGQNQYVLNNDGDHPTKMGCGPVVHMTRSTQLSLQLDYYQGPRYHIALVPMWRMVNTSNPSDPLCNQNGNSLFFDPNNNSMPLLAYNQLASRGWYPLGVANYSLAPEADYNPCTQGTNPVISNLVGSVDLEFVGYLLNWTTDIPATDQALLTDNTTGVQTLTTSDNVLRTQHSLQIKGLVPGHSYTVQAVSVSADLGKTLSDPLTFTFLH